MQQKSFFTDEASLYIDAVAALGEGAIWNSKTGELYWVDIEGGKVFTYDAVQMQMRSISVGQRVGTVVPSTVEGEVIVALQKGIYSLNLDSEVLQLIASAPFDSSFIRFNDGKCDPSGRFWVGSMALSSEPGAASLYRFDHLGTASKVLDGVSVSNGICWSADKKHMYYIDTPTQVVQAFDYTDSTGDINNSRVAVDLSEEEGSPDGMTIDNEGKLWIALWGGASVIRCDPDTGNVLARIMVPAKNITSCAFGGADFGTLFITSASIGMTEEDNEKYPLAGAVFAATPGVKGTESFQAKI